MYISIPTGEELIKVWLDHINVSGVHKDLDIDKKMIIIQFPTDYILDEYVYPWKFDLHFMGKIGTTKNVDCKGIIKSGNFELDNFSYYNDESIEVIHKLGYEFVDPDLSITEETLPEGLDLTTNMLLNYDRIKTEFIDKVLELQSGMKM